jgi:hypothetical protein
MNVHGKERKFGTWKAVVELQSTPAAKAMAMARVLGKLVVRGPLMLRMWTRFSLQLLGL